MFDRLRLFRLDHWAKNLFVFAPVFFAFRLFDPAAMAKSACAALAFGFVSSGVYVFNDILDRESDRLHPAKKDRPVAAGKVGLPEAAFLSVLMMAAGAILGSTLGTGSLGVLGAYLSINILYSLLLKHLPILDVLCVASGFVLRVVMGGTAAGIPLSHWILAMTFLLALFLVLAKRRDDLLLVLSGNGQGRKNPKGYSLFFLNAATVASAIVLLVTYLLYGLDPGVMAKMDTPYLYTTFFFVLMGILRYFQLTFVKNDSGSPTRHFYGDPVLQFAMLGWAGLFLFLLYGPKLCLFG